MNEKIISARILVTASNDINFWKTLDELENQAQEALPDLGFDLRFHPYESSFGTYWNRSLSADLPETAFEDLLPFADMATDTDISLCIEKEKEFKGMTLRVRLTISAKMPESYRRDLLRIGKIQTYYPASYETLAC